MNIRQVRQLLLPLGVAAAAVAALAWYAFIWIPAQQRFLNERNFRTLRTLSAQIEAKVDNFERALDHTIDSTTAPATDGVKTVSTDRNQALAKFIRLLVPELGLVPRPDTNAAKLAFDDAGDPPRVVLERDEGRTYLYIGVEHESQRMVAKADLGPAIGRFLATGDDFESLLLVDRDGIVIEQHSPLGLELARVDQLPSGASRPPVSSEKSTGGTAESFRALRMSNNSTDVLVGDATYKLYVQPIHLSLVRANAKRAAASVENKREMTDETEEWALCGLVRADKFKAASSAISYTYLLWLSAGVALVLCAIPMLKLHMLNRRERLTRTDGVLISSAAFFATGLVAFTVLDVHYFGREMSRRTENMLAQTANVLQRAMYKDIADVGIEMATLNDDLDRVLAKGSEGWNDNGPKIIAGERGKPGTRPTPCTPEWACRQTIFRATRDQRVDDVASPFVDLVNWSDSSGQQQVKWTTGWRLTPFINIVTEKVEYFEALRRAQRSRSAPQSGISAMLSPNTGEMLTVFWRVVPPKVVGAPEHRLVSQSAALSRYLPAFDHPVLPPHVQFAVVTRQGTVIYHSNTARSLKENFVQESQDDFALKSAIASAQTAALTAYYGGKRHRMYVMPLAVPAAAFTDPHWSLIMFQDATVAETVNLETLTVAVATFSLWGATLLIVWGLAAWLAPQQIIKWFWPQQGAASRYTAVAWVNGAIGVAALVAIVKLSTAGMLIATIGATVISAAVTYWIVTHASSPADLTRAWRREFVSARVSWLFVQAAVPAIACFCIAYDFEASLFVRDGQLQLARGVVEHHDALRERLEPIGLPDPERFASFDAASSLRLFFDTTIAVPDSADASVTAGVDALLRIFHRRYNAIAVQPETVSVAWSAHRPDASHMVLSHSASIFGDNVVLASAAPLAHGDVVFTVLVCLVFGGVYTLVRGVEPLFLIDLNPWAATTDATTRELPIANTIFVGLPGSADLLQIAGRRIVEIFDVRTLAMERRRQSRPVPLESRHVLHAALAVGATGGAAWSDAPPPSAEPRRAARWAEVFDYDHLERGGEVVGIDHVDYRFDDPEFRDQTLTLLEELLYRYQCVLWVTADRDPLDRLAELNAGAGERERWTVVLSSFTRRLLPTTITADTRDRLDDNAQPFYRSLWHACSTDEKLALRQLVDEDVVNPRNGPVIAVLVCKGLVRRERRFHVVSEPFRRFILEAVSASQVNEWEHESVTLPWTTLSTTLATVTFGLGSLLLISQQQLLDAWIGFMPTLAPVLPTMLKWLASAQTGSSSGTHV